MMRMMMRKMRLVSEHIYKRSTERNTFVDYIISSTLTSAVSYP